MRNEEDKVRIAYDEPTIMAGIAALGVTIEGMVNKALSELCVRILK